MLSKEPNGALFFKYVICAGIATLIDLGLFYFFTEYVHIWYFFSAFMSYMIGIIINYSLNKYLNFKNESKKIIPQFGLFASVALIGLVFNQIIIYLLVEFAGVWYMFAKIIAIFIVMFFNFYGHKKLTFGVFK